MASDAEERLRLKAEALMRRTRPGARIIHELVLEQGGTRIDIAAVDTDFLLVVEIKSDRDVLKRMARQLRDATQRADEVWLCVAEKHLDGVRDARRDTADRELQRALYRTRVFVEQGDTLAPEDGSFRTRPLELQAGPRFDLLWAAEQHAALREFWQTPTMKDMVRSEMRRVAVENMTGREVRRAVCAALRRRSFPRADEAV